MHPRPPLAADNAAFRDMLLHRENVILLRLTLDAVASVGIEDKDQVEDAEKN
ncbi:MAG: hypothetical protein ABF479_06450 [Gluconacetobacter sp.]|uniref:Uncharacterized protein n=1 Tax=Gluconacetobacter dulcium TaxID=2729096 RepID=A0A7W4PFU7_9PROT|nr:hypothetical protein [Gluconacetobacter dulcium]MBB2196013.1 hypothetical protein [Gluconacetobacter dulcium]